MRTTKYPHRTIVVLPDDLLERLNKEVSVPGISKSDVVRSALREYFENKDFNKRENDE